jgi:hypothetical protein
MRIRLAVLGVYTLAMGYLATPARAEQVQFCDEYVLDGGYEFKFSYCDANGYGVYTLCDPFRPGGESDILCDGFYGNPDPDGPNWPYPDTWAPGEYGSSCWCGD